MTPRFSFRHSTESLSCKLYNFSLTALSQLKTQPIKSPSFKMGLDICQTLLGIATLGLLGFYAVTMYERSKTRGERRPFDTDDVEALNSSMFMRGV